MEDQLIEKISRLGVTYIPIPEASVKIIHDLFFLNVQGEPQIIEEYLYFGLYYQFVELNFDRLHHYYLQAISLDCTAAMDNLAMAYQNIRKDYDMAKKYYFMAIERGESSSMVNLGLYYKNVEKDYEKMKYYYEMAVALDSKEAMNNLGFYYEHVEQNYELMKKYYLRAIDLNNGSSMNNIACYYDNIENNPDMAVQYYLMAIKRGNATAMSNLALYYRKKGPYYLPLVRKYAHMAIRAGNQGALSWMTEYYLGQVANQDGFDFGVEYRITSLIVKNYYPGSVSRLLLVANEFLSESLRQQKKQYTIELLSHLTAETTWFHPAICVKDVRLIIQAYLVG